MRASAASDETGLAARPNFPEPARSRWSRWKTDDFWPGAGRRRLMRAAVITFPGSNCDRDLAVAMEAVFGAPVRRVWHQETELPQLDLIGVPGGFSYGDYLRCGAIAARSPVMREVARRAERGAHVLGVCNGFQILAEAGLLPGR